MRVTEAAGTTRCEHDDGPGGPRSVSDSPSAKQLKNMWYDRTTAASSRDSINDTSLDEGSIFMPNLTDHVGVITCAVADQSQANELAGYLKDRIGSERTDQLFHRVREIKPFIDEANLLNEELLGDEDYEYVFNPHLLTGVVTADMAPELGVVLYKIRNADDIDIAGKPIFQTEDPPTQLLAVWSESVFMSRLDVIRDLHHFVSERGKPWGEEGDADPWSDVQGITCHLSPRPHVSFFFCLCFVCNTVWHMVAH